MYSVYVDEDTQENRLVKALRDAGFDCLTVNEADMLRRPDDELLAFATSEGRILYTKNTGDFSRLDRRWRSEGRSHAGIIVVTNQLAPIGVQQRALLRLATERDAEAMRGHLAYLLNYAHAD